MAGEIGWLACAYILSVGGQLIYLQLESDYSFQCKFHFSSTHYIDMV